MSETSLKHIFGYDSFRPGQQQIINSVLNKNDVLTLMPTGAGKSLCYQLPAITSKGLTIVISPLISLIHDQIQALRKLNVVCYHLNSTTSSKDINSIWKLLEDASQKHITESKCKMVYTTPETMVDNEDFMMMVDRIYENNLLEGFVIDEAHCVSNWGHDFRPSYLELSVLKEYYPCTPIWAYTATATDVVRKDIMFQLKMEKDAIIFKTSFIRENLSYQIIKKDYHCVKKEVSDLIHDKYHGKSGIIYCLSRKDCESYAEYLSLHGISAGFYHAKLLPTTKTEIQNKWINNEILVIVATIAFALGINKPDVRFVIHTSMPKSIESFYQESGRAGRDLNNSDCVLFYSYGDKAILDKMTRSSNKDEVDTRDPEQVKNMLENIYSMYTLATNNICIKRQFSNYLGEYIDYTCQKDTNKCLPCKSGLSIHNNNMIGCSKQVMSLIPREKHHLINTIAKRNSISKINIGNLINYMITKQHLDVLIENNKETIICGSISLPKSIFPPQTGEVKYGSVIFDKGVKTDNDPMWKDPTIQSLMLLMEKGGLK
jgi:RecQ family ATP-dependent DNA helicase